METTNETVNEAIVLATGDDVCIVGGTTIFRGKNGQVKAILPTGKVEVHFFPEFSHLFGHEYSLGKTTWEFDAEELEKIKLESFPRWRVSRLYNRVYHTLRTLNYEFSPENDCMCNGCSSKATKRIMYNASGTVGEYDVCDEHAKKDGAMGDFFDAKPGYWPKVKESR